MAENAYIKEDSEKEKSRIQSFRQVEAFLAHLGDIGQSPKTVEIRRTALRLFLEFSGGISFTEVDTELLDGFRLSLVERTLCESTVDMYMRSAKVFFGYLEENNLIFDNPFVRIRMHRPEYRRMDILSGSQVRRLLAGSDDPALRTGRRNRAILETLYSTGMRLGEISGLNLRDVCLKTCTVRVFGKGRKERVIPLGKYAVKYIRLYLERDRSRLAGTEHRDCDSLWLSRYGEAMTANGVSLVLDSAGKRAGIKRRISCHLIRRTCATHMLRNGAHPMLISKMLGHASVKTLAFYLNITLTDLMKTHRKSRPGS